MSGTVLAAGLVAVAHPEHLVLLGLVVVIGLVVFAVSRRRRRQEGQTVDELNMRELSTENTKLAETRQPGGHHRDRTEQRRHGGPH